MGRIAIKADINVYELDGKEVEIGGKEKTFTVRSHWNRDEMIVILIGSHEYTVSASDLVSAINRCSGWRR